MLSYPLGFYSVKEREKGRRRREVREGEREKKEISRQTEKDEGSILGSVNYA